MADKFQKAKNVVLRHLIALTNFCVELERFYPALGFAEHAASSIALYTKVAAAQTSWLTIDDLQKYENLRQHLMSHTTLHSKLRQYGEVVEHVAKSLIIEESLWIDAERLFNSIPRLSSFAALSNEVLKELRTDPYSLRSLLAIMLVYTNRRETFFHSTKSLVEKAAKDLKITQYDFAEIFSLTSKVRHNTTFETDIDVIRHCIAHGMYQITKAEKDQYLIHFENHEKGYHYEKDFTNREFYAFFSDYYLFERLLSIIFGMSLNRAMMATYLTA